jgi:hypothetical protein
MPVEVKGLIETQKALKKFAPDLYEEMRKEIKVALKTVSDQAKSMVQPAIYELYNLQSTGVIVKSRTSRAEGFPKYDPKIIRKGLTYSLGAQKKNPAGFIAMYSLLNKSRIGSIIETAGRKNFNGDPKSESNNPNAGAHFNRAIQGTYGGFGKVGKSRMDKGRILMKAVEKDQGKIYDAVFKAIAKAEHKYMTTSKTDRYGLAA